MAEKQHQQRPDTGRTPPAKPGIKERYRRFNAAAWGLPGIALKLALVSYFLFCAILLSLRFYVLPNIGQYKNEIEKVASRAVGKPVSIAQLEASWDGLRPHLELKDVMLRDKRGQPALSLPRIAATIAWESIPVFDLRLHKLDVYQPELDVRKDASGKLYIAGLPFIPSAKSGSPSADWIFRQNNIAIHDGRLRWTDEQRGAPPLTLDKINLIVKNGWHRHRFFLNAVPPAELAAPIDLRADFKHPHFAENISNVRQWKGKLYANLEKTDLSAWQPYVDLPLELQNGHGSVRIWLALDKARLTEVTADVQLADFSVQLRKDLPVLNLHNARGRVAAKADIDLAQPETASFWEGLKHTISLTRFSAQTKEGLTLPETSVSNVFTPASKGKPETHAITAQQLDLDALAKFTQFLPLATDQHQMLTDFAPSGRLKDFSVEWQGSYPDIYSYNVKGKFENLLLKAQAPRPAIPAKGKTPARPRIPGIPGFDNLSGFIDADQNGGSFSLDANDLVLQLPGYFENPAMDFDAFQMQANWAYPKDKPVEVELKQLAFKHHGLSGSVEGTLKLPRDRKSGEFAGEADLSGTFNNFKINTVGRYLPLQMPEFTRQWLAHALEGGTVPKGSFVLKGNLADFPFTEKKGKKSKGEFNLTMQIDKGKLNYKPGFYGRDGRSPLWPQAEEIDGTLTFKNARMEIFAKSAKTVNVDLQNVSAIIPNLDSDDPKLLIDGTAIGAMPNFIRYTRISPVAVWINDFTEDTKTDGTGKLHLAFQMPLNHAIDTTVQGALEFQGNTVKLIRDLPLLTRTKGLLTFNEKGFALKNFGARFLGGNVAISGGTQKNKRILIHAKGTLTGNGLRKAYPGMTKRIRGSANYTADIDASSRQPTVTVKSSLRGMALDFPAPARKTARESWPLTFRASPLKSRDKATLLDQFRLAIGNNKEAFYIRERSKRKYAPWKVIRGGIGVNTAAPEPAHGLAMHVVTSALDIDAWDEALSAQAKTKASSKNGDVENAFMQYIDPTLFTAHANTLSVAGLNLDEAIINAHYKNKQWEAQVESTQAEGTVGWRDLDTGNGQVTARLKRLTVQKSTVDEVGKVLTSNKASQHVPAIDLQTEKLDLFGKQWGQVELLADHRPIKKGAEWTIDKLRIRNPDFTLNANGNWRTQSGLDRTQVNYKLKVSNAGKMLKRIGYAGVLRDGEGTLKGKLQWRNDPFNFDKATLTGNAVLNMEDGQFLKAEPGVARLLSLLSLQSLPKRLTLDFRDIFSAGFAFDTLTANADIKNGQLSTQNLKMVGLNASIFMEGIADLGKETQNLHVLVIPEVNALGASVVYGLAVNPVVGLGTFLAQLVLRDPVKKTLTYEYQITGTWDDPKVTKIERNPGGAKRKPAPITEIKQ